MNKHVQRRNLIEDQLHGALNRGEINVLFQPVVDLSNFQVVGAEALVRWHSEILGDVSPNEFIPIAEQSEQIITIGAYVIEKSLNEAQRWKTYFDRNFDISINVSPNQLKSESAYHNILSKIITSPLPKNSIQLEITEGVLLTATKSTELALQRLHELGVQIALDDFGTGYSSLSYLRKYPFTTVKIDQTFTRDIMTDPADRELISATVAMGKALNLKLVAEGIETDDQSNYLRNLKCDIGQGFLYSKPLHCDQFIEFVDHFNATNTASQGDTATLPHHH